MADPGKMPKRGRSLHVLKVLRKQIAEGRYPLESRLPSERDLADEFKVSRVTVRKALEQLTLDGMISRRPGLGNLVTATEPVKPEVANDVGFVVQHLDNPYYSAFASALESVLRTHDLGMVLAGTAQDPDEELRSLQRMRVRQVRGVILCVPDRLHHPEAVAALLQERLPVVVIGGRQPGIAVDTVDSDNRAGMTAAVEHLLELGHRRIGFLSAMAFGRVDVRLELTAELLRTRGLEPGPAVRVDTPDFAGGREALDRMLEHTERPTALLCTNDITAIGAVQRAFELGVSIPGEFSIAGYDDIPMAAMATVPLTTVAVPLAEVAVLAFERLTARAEGYSGRPIHLMVEPALVARASTGPPR